MNDNSVREIARQPLLTRRQFIGAVGLFVIGLASYSPMLKVGQYFGFINTNSRTYNVGTYGAGSY